MVDARVALNKPTTVEEACETKPPPKSEATDVDVAVKDGAVIVSYAVNEFLKSAFPFTSKIFPVVVVAD